MLSDCLIHVIDLTPEVRFLTGLTTAVFGRLTAKERPFAEDFVSFRDTVVVCSDAWRVARVARALEGMDDPSISGEEPASEAKLWFVVMRGGDIIAETRGFAAWPKNEMQEPAEEPRRIVMQKGLVFLALMFQLFAFGALTTPSVAQEPQEPAKEPNKIDEEFASKLAAIPLVGDTKTPEEAGLKRISKTERIWIDPKNKLVVIDGSIALTDGPLEMFACPRRSKEHESVVAVDCKSSTAHAALLAIGALEGKPVQYNDIGEITATATGTEIEVYALWKKPDGVRQTTRAQEWVRNGKDGKALAYPWVFVGSAFSRDEETKRSFYLADAGEFICVSNFTTATMDLPIASSDKDAARMFEVFAERVPARGTPIRLVLMPKAAKKAEEAKPAKEEPKSEAPKEQPSKEEAPKSEPPASN